MNANRVGLALVIVAFCLPLFVGLGRGDFWGDEAIYSFGVEKMLESGDWLIPKSSPHEDAEFLEKPPLKFWIVAGSIRLGLLPNNEFGFRFWDALFGAAALLYVYGIGCRLAGSVCGVVAGLTLFAFGPLLFEHGLRSNNMEAPLFLCYCGGVYHYLRACSEPAAGGDGQSAASRGSDRVAWHAVAVALYFVLGFMTKFVAAIFLPIVLGATTLLVPSYRRTFARDWRLWTAAGALAPVLIAPWFIYAFHRYGMRVWNVMLASHVFARMTGYLDPEHVQPWSYYWVNLYKGFSYSGAVVLVLAGTAVLLVQTIRRRWPAGALVLLWFALPVPAISMGTSKLIHYVYPFVPPLALGAGYLAALLLMLAPAPLARLAALRRPPVRALMAAVAAVAGALATVTLVHGEIRFDLGAVTLFRNAAVLRPALVALLAAVLATGSRRSARLAALLFVAVLVPVSGYAQNLARLEQDDAPLRTLRDCLLHVEATASATPPGLYVDVPDAQMWHPIYYYFRAVRPWTRAESIGPVRIDGYLDDPQTPRPILIATSRYLELARATPPPLVRFTDFRDTLMLLPGPYAVCRTDAAGSGRSR